MGEVSVVSVGQGIGEAERPQLSPEMLVGEYLNYKRQRLHGRSVATANWVTTLAHPCAAYAVYMRTIPAGERRQMKDSLGMIFSEGDDQARAIKRDLLDMGWEVEGAEGQMAWPNYQITGRQDLKLRKAGFPSVYAEIKSCSPFTYMALNSPDDAWEHKYHFIQKWAKQVALYMVLKGVSRYWMVLKNKSTGQIKILDFTLGDRELQAAEDMLQKAEKVNRLIQIGQMPGASMKASDKDLCSECEFFEQCRPQIDFGPGARILTDETAGEMAEKAARREELKPLADEFKELDEELKGEVKGLLEEGQENLVFGDWIATVKRVEKKAYTVKAQTQTQVKLVRVGSQG